MPQKPTVKNGQTFNRTENFPQTPCFLPKSLEKNTVSVASLCPRHTTLRHGVLQGI